MEFRPNISPTEVIKKGTYFRDKYSSVNDIWYKNSWKKFKGIYKEYHASDFYDVSVNKYGVKCRTSVRFWESKEWMVSMVFQILVNKKI